MSNENETSNTPPLPENSDGPQHPEAPQVNVDPNPHPSSSETNAGAKDEPTPSDSVEQKVIAAPESSSSAPAPGEDRTDVKPVLGTKKDSPTQDAAAEAPAKVPPKPAAAAPPPPPPEPGVFAKLLQEKGYTPGIVAPAANKMEIIDVKADELRDVCLFLRDNPASRFDLLVSIAGVDWKDRMEGVYHLYSTSKHHSLALKAAVVDGKLPSVMSVWHTADWHERETYDLFGIKFEGHPNLTRILMPSDWIGFPLRKDYTVDDPRLVWNER